MSPVCSTVPAGVRMPTASASGMEWLTAKNCRSNGPTVRRSPSATTSSFGLIRCSRHFAAISASENRAPITGRSLRSRSSHGSAPM